jgi:hypothetical protein
MKQQSIYSKDGIILDYDYFKIASIMTILKAKGLYQNKPSLTMPFLDWFESYDFSSFNLIEFGSGNSTNYFYEKTKNIISFETDINYYNNLQPLLSDDIDYRFIQKYDLENKIPDIEINDKTIMFIDSASNRFLLIKNIFKIGSPNILILNNSNDYKNTCKFIYNKGYSEIPFWGLTFMDVQESCTSVFIKNNFNMIEKNNNYMSSGSFINQENTWDIDPE